MIWWGQKICWDHKDKGRPGEIRYAVININFTGQAKAPRRRAGKDGGQWSEVKKGQRSEIGSQKTEIHRPACHCELASLPRQGDLGHERASYTD